MNNATRLALQVHSAQCVEDILRTTEKDSVRTPWVVIIETHMKSLLKCYERNKRTNAGPTLSNPAGRRCKPIALLSKRKS